MDFARYIECPRPYPTTCSLAQHLWANEKQLDGEEDKVELSGRLMRVNEEAGEE